MSIVVPAVLPQTRAELEVALTRLAAYPEITDVQIDVVDGKFARPASWPYAANEVWQLPLAERFSYDLDLMVEDPGASLGKWVELGARRITVHVESAPRLGALISDFKKRFGHEAGFLPDSLSLGLAIGLQTPITVLEPFINEIDYVELMGIASIGHQGEPFDARVLPKIRALRASYPHLPIQIDGGVSLTTAPGLLSAGASRLIAGSALLHAPDIAHAIAEFEVVGEKYGSYER